MSFIVLVAMVAAALAAGGLAVVSVGIVRAGKMLDARAWSTLHRALERALGPYFRMLLPSAIAATAAVAFVHDMTSTRVAYAIAALLLAAALGVSIVGNVPINRDVAAWREPPADWAERRARWNAWQTVRAVAALTALALVACYSPGAA